MSKRGKIIPIVVPIAAAIINIWLFNSSISRTFTASDVFLAVFYPFDMLFIYFAFMCYYGYKGYKEMALIFTSLTIITINVSLMLLAFVIGKNDSGISIDDMLDCILNPLDMGLFLFLLMIHNTNGYNYKTNMIISAFLGIAAYVLVVEVSFIENEPRNWYLTIITLIIPLFIMIKSNLQEK